MKLVGCALLLLAVTSPAFAGEHYTEIWNPPEARGGVHHDPAPAAPKKHKRVVPRLVEAHMHHPAVAAAPKLTVKPRAIDNEAPRGTSGAPDIPRQFTPDGNVLRVRAQGRGNIEVVR